MRRLAEILDSSGLGDVEIAGLSADSRTVEPGDVFFALTGAKDDGNAHVAQALAKGAAIIVSEREPAASAAAVTLRVANARAALAAAAARYYPEQPATIVAITGTSGKTSIATFVRQIWERLALTSASLGTIGVVSKAMTRYGSLTTPDPIVLHQTLQELAKAGVTHLALEASSHGLDQRRLDGVRLRAVAFVNLSRDHLDYHAGLEDYLAAKLRLFTVLAPAGAPAVVNADSDHAGQVIDAARGRALRVFTVGAKGADIRLAHSEREGFSTRLRLIHAGREWTVNLPLAGEFQASNALVAAGLCIATGGAPAAVFAALETLQGAPGRLERVGRKNGAEVFVDYAHKPDALEKTLQALRPFVRNRLIVIFGCGGDRDAGKRPIMGEIATRCADVVIVTDDNPRSENPAAIRAAILASAPGAREIGDRGQAIASGVAMLQPGDALLIAGKGHETGQIVGAATLPFSDSEAARAALGWAA